MTAGLYDQGHVITEKTVAKIMRSLGVVGIRPHTFKVRNTVVDPFASFPTTWSSAESIWAASTRCGPRTSHT
ncbi:hypothetical protein CH272_13425 [Rhodococcus sp. 05-340-1]|nr:hypothetical protein CH271_21930 [Rhodococcus sp. 05-340-2]OZD76663.1 hypothetical protein CH272_13425 [Rhodococcus sp. 05-340-1]